ncbi:hypothetical protein [Litorisediminicola beolgyonensis]|uniref:Uncharacterized protein n=1 Tax=Litorisediminicola beolgyonensis TaxID=1173614 RepID=A0ABW3ZCQ1_9RHOB
MRMISAGARALLVAWVVVLPALMMPGLSADAAQVAALLGLLAALLTFIEYVSIVPSFVEFRSAPPFNRMRFLTLFAIAATASVLVRNAISPTLFGDAMSGMAALAGRALDFPFSPVRLMMLLLPEGTKPSTIVLIRDLAGVTYLLAMASVALFFVVIKLMGWPIRRKAFNVWINLPLFDPTAGGDVLYRLKRDASVNAALGFLLPFLLPAVMKTFAEVAMPLSLVSPQTLVWTITAWAFLSASLIMRGIALMRVAELIEEKRRRAYAQTEHFAHA